MRKKLIVIIAIGFCNLMISCTSTEYLSRDNCYTCWPIIYSNDEYSEEEFGYKKREQDSLYDAWKKEHPGIAGPQTLKGNFRVKEIWIEKEFGVAVFFLDDMSDSPLRCKQVLSLMDKPNYKGISLKIGDIYYFELKPLNPINTAPTFGYRAEELLLGNRWLMVEHFCGENIYSSVNLNGDKYIRDSQKNSKTAQ